MTVVLLITLLGLLSGPAISQTDYYTECYVDDVPVRCEPIRMSFSLDQQATATSTCGNPSTPYCVRSISLGRVVTDCSGGEICDANDPDNNHNVSYLTDFPLNEMSWWQSENSPDSNHQVVLEIPLLTLAEISFISFGFQSIKAAAFRLEKSTDYGQTYQPFHYLALSCTDAYGIDPDLELTRLNEASILCQTIPEPPTPGSITFFPAIDRPSANDSTPGYSENLYQFITATNIRVVFDQHYELDLSDDDPGYYYALDDINVIGSCQCHGHASQCIANIDTGLYECVCKHNTTGTYCEMCQDFYHDVPWQRSDGNVPFECKRCNCNNHSTECVFDEQVYSETGRISGGVCLNCDGNTAGRQCESCAPFYYPQPDREQSEPDVCQACECALDGVIDNGDCVKERGGGTHQPGDCYCKANVMGTKCDMCLPGYFNLSADNPNGCQECNCSINGSSNQTCNHLTGECECKLNVVGQQCDSCRENYYQSEDPNEGCLPCDCNPGGSLRAQCNMITGQCDCREGVTGLKCDSVNPGNFFPAIDHLRLEGESAISIPPSVLTVTSGEGEDFTGTGYYRVIEGEGIASFGTLIFPQSGTYEILFRYNLVGALVWNSVTLTIRAGLEEGEGEADCGSETELPVGDTSISYTSWTMGTGVYISRSLCFRAGRVYTFILSQPISGQDTSPTLDIDSLVAIPTDIPSLALFDNTQLVADYLSCVNYWHRVSTISSAGSTCRHTTFIFSTAIYGGALDCDCDPNGALAGTVCDEFGGQCVCLPGVRGRRCDACRPGTFDFSPSGCSTCSCDPIGSVSEFCDPDLGTCDCLPNVAGPNCSSCESNFWGLTDDSGCIPCSCNLIGSTSEQCNAVSGECPCKPGVIGSQCDTCEDGFFGLSTDGCSPCSCSQAGSLGHDCDAVTGECMCKDNTRKRDCSVCIPGTFFLQESNPDGCRSCFCSGLGVTCLGASGYVAGNVSTDFNAGLEGWTVRRENFTMHSDPDSVVMIVPFSNGVTLLPNSVAYLKAPGGYLGKRLTSYLQMLTIDLEYQSSFTETTTQYDVIITGSNLSLGTKFPMGTTSGLNTLSILFHESFSWYHIDTNQDATSSDLLTVLSSLDGLYITAGFNSSVILSSVYLDIAEASSTPSQGEDIWVEQCDCPSGYSGLSCETCSQGYTRAPDGSCGLCQCNGFSSDCDSETGVCMNCTASTSGDNCEQCLPGMYGDPTQGIDCLPCPCPLTTTPGQFSTECVLQGLDTVVCLNCPLGHTGSNCEYCSAGYFGDPTGENGTPTGCSDCLCNGNIDTSLSDSCNTTTGICLNCMNNTGGNMCERCADGYFGDAIVAKNCTECDCDPIGSVDGSCDHTTGVCLCLQNVEGSRCEACTPGYYGFSSGIGCISCGCNLQGATDSICDSETGQCNCKPGVTGLLCDQCATGYFRFSDDGCQACNCSSANSVFSTCDSTGICQCLPGSTGVNCESCIENYFQDEEGCKECPQCYQELQQRLENVTELHRRVESNLFNLLIEASPYDPRLNAQQDEVNSIANLGEMYSQRHSELLIEVAGLTTLVSETIQRDVTELETNLQLLKTISTPVFLQALAAEELMIRTIDEFQMAQEEIAKLAEIHIPNITYSLIEINDSHSIGSETLDSLLVQVTQLSIQADQISRLVSKLVNFTNSSIATADNIQTSNQDTQVLANILHQNLSELVQTVHTLTQNVRLLSMDIMQLSIGIAEQLNNLPTVQSPESLEELNASLLSSQSTIKYLSNQVDMKYYELSHLQEVVRGRKNAVNLSSETLSDFMSKATTLEDEVNNITNIARATVMEVEDKIYHAKLVLENLQNFSDSTFDVARRANEALNSVSGLTYEAIGVLERATTIQQNVSELISLVDEAVYTTHTAGNTTHRAQTVLSTIDVDSLAENVSESQNSSHESVHDALQLQEYAENLQDYLVSLSNNSDHDEETIYNSSQLTSESEVMIHDANDSVTALQEALSSLDSTDPSQLQQTISYIVAELSLLESEITEADIQTLYNSLLQSLHQQRSVRQSLESDVAELEEDIENLKHLQSSLPAGCGSTL